MILERFYPDYRVKSAYAIDYKRLYQAGVRGILFDIDNTLVPHGAPAGKRAVKLFQKLRGIGLETCLISNNKEDRVLPFAKAVGAAAVCDAGKPSKKGYLAAMEKMGTRPSSTIFVGDQLFTDIYGAKRAGIPSLLVEPIHPKEEIQIVLKRYLERVVLFFYERRSPAPCRAWFAKFHGKRLC